jgi:hypothetical protein
MVYRHLDAVQVAQTIERLCRRIEHRFPESGLAHVCRELDVISEHTKERAAWIGRPFLLLRVGVGALITAILLGLVASVAGLGDAHAPRDLAGFIQVLEAGLNALVLIGAAVFFLLSVEKRVKRRRALEALHELRSIAHVIDMHQLTKDPEFVIGPAKDGGLVARELSRFELSRYLDYCSEALALTAKVAAVYAEHFDDDVALQAVNEIEDLTNGLSRKIWQKLMILHTTAEAKE